MNLKNIVSKALLLISIALVACTHENSHEFADLVVEGGTIYTMDEQQPTAESIAVLDGKIIFVGSEDKVKDYITEETRIIDLQGKTMTPGFIESHGHMMGLGYNELNLDLSGVKNYDELVDMVAKKVETSEPGEWIVGRGWHQSKWDPQPDMVKGFQTHDKLSAVSPDNPVYLRHASGHASFANAKAMEIAGVNQMSVESLEKEIDGGEIIRDENGNPTGIFNERAQSIISRYIPENDEDQNEKALELAIKACQENGITGFHDAGVGQETIDRYIKFKNEGKLGVRMYVMVSGPDRELTRNWLDRGVMIDSVDHFLTVRSIKLNCDGALGSRGAWLLEEYSDRPGHFGMATLPMDYVLEVSRNALQRGFQVNSHAIGDRTNREVLDRYDSAFREFPELATDHRFRIEHAQHLHPDDIPRFGELGVIAAMQAIHLSSDRPWAIDRLGEKRIKEGAYMWQALIQSGAVVCNGTDVPVEPIDPIACFYASVTRKTLLKEPEGGYEPEQKMTREQALRSYTLNGAYAQFEENVKGSIEVGKLADFTVFSQDIMTIDEDDILDTDIAMTILNGQVVYENANLIGQSDDQ